MVGRAYVEGRGVPRDTARGEQTLRAACDRLGGFPCHMLGVYREDGSIGAPAPDAASAAYARACDTGLAMSCGEAARLRNAP